MIRILDNLTINKIAAGEVIERPVNVVKELVENAIDAGSKNISVEIKGGGIDYIRVTDDGCGISYEDVPTAFLRHATSKIVSSEDLFFLSTLGFRGEALASIASVSHTEMITRTSTDVMGTKINLDCGSVIEMIKTGAPEGTTIIVKDLFFNVPARKKFLNSPSSEATKIIEMMEELVLSNPSIAFQLLVNGQVKIQTNGSGNLKDVIFRLFGKEIHEGLLPLDYEDDFIKIQGYITKPDFCRPSRSGEYYFINGRFVKNDFVTRGIEEGYRNFLMQHKFPFVVLFIELDPFGIDVNVHPAKSEVRITNGEFLVEILSKTINDALTKNELIPSAFKFKEEEAPLERAPEPFEKNFKKGDLVVQKGYDGKKGVNNMTAAESEAYAQNDKSKEFTVDFEEKKDKPNNEFMNHITTIPYKSKYDKFEERMKNDVEDDEESAEEVKETVSDTAEAPKDDYDFLRNDTTAEAPKNVVIKKDSPNYDFLTKDTTAEAPKSTVAKEENPNYDFLTRDTTAEAPKSTVAAEKTSFNKATEFAESQGNIKDESSYDTTTQGSSLLTTRIGSHKETAEDYIDKDGTQGSALLKNRIAAEKKDSEEEKSVDTGSHGSALFKKDIFAKEDEVKEEVPAETPLEAAEDTPVEAAVTEEAVPDAAEEQTEPVNMFEEWLASIENKEESEIEQENKGMIVKFSEIPENSFVSEEEDDSNDAFMDYKWERKADIIDRVGEKSKEDDSDRLKDADKKYSVLNDDITPVKTDMEAPKKSKFTFRVKDFEKDTDDEVVSPKVENVENIFKKVDRFNSPGKKEPKVKETQSVLFNEKTLDPSKLSKFTIIDQIFDTYWLISVENELLIMDQHAAHEKVLYEKFMDKFKNNKIETQTLMLSQVVNLSKAEMDVYLRYKNEFEKFGFVINDFGDRDLFIRGIPTDLFGSDAKSLFLDILSELINVSPSLHIDIIENRIATRACKAAIKGNQKMSKDECKKLLEFMLTLKNPYQCPHGRPTLIRISKTDLEKMFKRIVS
ncbi:MAG: DNA mismatch repair endonuclease MutL [Lachnospiraceae bacterium]|nr:DNA mismatch repair endonuclease MutL [Lachnospiraceae bacterium]